MKDTPEQFVLNQVWQHFIVEGNPLSGDMFNCLYRDPDGAKCAIGLFIPDEMYTPEMENYTVTLLPNFVGKETFFSWFPEGICMEFLQELQLAHDGSDNLEDMERRLRKLADYFSDKVEIPCP